MRNSKWHPKGDTQDDTQDVTQGVTQEDTLDEKIEKAIKDNLNVTTEELGVSGFFRLVIPYVRNKVLPACT